MPQEIKDLKVFLQKTRRPDASLCSIKKNKKQGIVKFKLRTARTLYTYQCKESKKIDRIKQSIPSSVRTEVVGEKK